MQSNRCTCFPHFIFLNFSTQFCQVRQVSEQDHTHCCDTNNLISQRGACPPTLWSFHTLSVFFSTPFHLLGNACVFFLSLDVAIPFTGHNSPFQSLYAGLQYKSLSEDPSALTGFHNERFAPGFQHLRFFFHFPADVFALNPYRSRARLYISKLGYYRQRPLKCTLIRHNTKMSV